MMNPVISRDNFTPGAQKFKQYSNFPFYPWSPSYTDVGFFADVFGLRGSLEQLRFTQQLVVWRDRKRKALLRKFSQDGLLRQSITLLFVIYCTVGLHYCQIVSYTPIPKMLSINIFHGYSILISEPFFLKLAAGISRNFLTGFISSFSVFSPHCFLHANVDYAILLIVFKHGCWVITIALPLCPNISLLIKDFEKCLVYYTWHLSLHSWFITGGLSFQD